MAFQLVIAEGKEAGREFVFDQDSVVIGRTPECDVILYDTGVSRRHARIFDEGRGFQIEDLGSANGTIVNGSKVARQPLKDGDSIALGPVKFTFTASDLEPSTDPEAAVEPAPAEGGGQHTRVVDAAKLARSRKRAVAMLPQNVNTGEREQLERRPTQSIPAVSGPRPSAPRSPRTSNPAMLRPDAAALAGPRPNTPRSSRPSGLSTLKPDPVAIERAVQVGGAAEEQRLSAADKARLRREGALGAAKVWWFEASLVKRIAVAGSLSAFLLFVVALFLSAVLPEEVKKKAPEATVLGELPVEQVFGLGPSVGYERVDQKEFEFEVKSPVEVMVVLHYQCKDISEGELSLTVNGVDMGFAPPDTLNVNEVEHELLIPAKHIKRNQTNTVVFDNTRNPPEKATWAIWNLWVEITVLPVKDDEGLKADAAERFTRGDEKWTQRDIGAPNRWEAYKAYREAWLFFEAMPSEQRGPIYQLAHDKMIEARRELDDRCRKLLMQARAEFNQGKFDEASATLDWVEKYFPTKAHPCQLRANLERDELAGTLDH